MATVGGSIAELQLDLTVSFPKDDWTKSLNETARCSLSSNLSALLSLASVGDENDAASDTEIFSSFKGIDKGYNFFKSGHVQQIEMVHKDASYFVRSNVLSSMKKCAPYKTKICLLLSGMAKLALCTCTAGLAGCCNHVAALLYALVEFVRFGLCDEKKSPTSRLCKWNRPRDKRVKPKKIIDVRLHRVSFSKKHAQAPKAFYNPVPPNKLLVELSE